MYPQYWMSVTIALLAWCSWGHHAMLFLLICPELGSFLTCDMPNFLVNNVFRNLIIIFWFGIKVKRSLMEGRCDGRPLDYPETTVCCRNLKRPRLLQKRRRSWKRYRRKTSISAQRKRYHNSRSLQSQTRMYKRVTRGLVRKRNANGEMLYVILDRHQFIAANTIFKHKVRHIKTWEGIINQKIVYNQRLRRNLQLSQILSHKCEELLSQHGWKQIRCTAN